MIKYAITVTYVTDDMYWFDGYWKDEVCEEFDENVVIPEDRDHSGFEKASWWKDAKDVISDIDSYLYDWDELSEYCDGVCAKDKLKAIFDFYTENDYSTDDTEFIAEVARILYPFLNIEVGGIRGYHDSAEVVYNADELADLDVLEDWFYGNIYEVTGYELDAESMAEDDIDAENMSVGEVEDYGTVDEGSHPITSTEYFKYRHDAKEICSWFGYPEDETVVVED